VFLINHGMSCPKLLEIHRAVHREYPDWWVGVNCLDLPPTEIFSRVGSEVAGIWVDNAMIDERTEQQRTAEAIAVARERSGWKGLYFGGVAFKYQRAVDNLATAGKIAAKYMDGVTTSGPGTGMAAEPEKIRMMRQALGSTPLAIASGITPENVRDYLGFADCFLVATGISKSFTELDGDKLTALLRVVAEADEPLAEGSGTSVARGER